MYSQIFSPIIADYENIIMRCFSEWRTIPDKYACHSEKHLIIILHPGSLSHNNHLNENINLQKTWTKSWTFSSRWIFHTFGAQDWVFKTDLRFFSIFLKFWHSVSFVKDFVILCWSVAHTIFQYFLVKNDLCSCMYRRFSLRRSEMDVEYQNNHALTVQD